MKHPLAAAAVLTALVLVTAGTASLFIDATVPSELRTFASEGEMLSFLGSHRSGPFLDGLFGRDNAVQESAASAPDRSGTNVQVAGVDEGDMVKTDGRYIYVSDGQAVHVVRADAGTLENTSVIEAVDGWQVSALYLDGDRLVVIRSYGGPAIMESSYWHAGVNEQSTALYSYNVSDPSRPVLEHQAAASGWHHGSRMVDGTVYAVVQESIWTNNIVSAPVVSDGDGTVTVAATDIIYDPSVKEVSSFISLLAFDVASGESTCLTVAAPSSSVMYMSPSSLYLTMPDNARSDSVGTTIYRFDVDTLNVTLEAKGSVNGYVMSQFSMDEHGGFLRVASSSGWSSPYTMVTVLDHELKGVGKLSNIAPGETLYSSRFMGDRLYLVTAIQVDPLFVVDLSDPTAPTLRGELKVPGISTYLQMTEHGLLGIGTENGTLKVSLFNVTDDVPTEIDTYRFIGYAYSDAQWDHHAVLWDERHDMLSLPVHHWSYDHQPRSSLAVLSVDESGIRLLDGIEHPDTVRRALYIGDHLYSISTTMIKASSLPELTAVGDLAYRTVSDGHIWYGGWGGAER